jgi:hypothetical protein
MYRHQLEDFGRDHHSLAPDLRGYNLSSKPENLHEYGAWPAARDIRALVMSVRCERFVLVGLLGLRRAGVEDLLAHKDFAALQGALDQPLRRRPRLGALPRELGSAGRTPRDAELVSPRELDR